MGTVCYGTQPPEKFVGTWTNKTDESLIIYPSGFIYYIKQVYTTLLLILVSDY